MRDLFKLKFWNTKLTKPHIWVFFAIALFIFASLSLVAVKSDTLLDYGEGVTLNLAKNLVDHGTYFFDIARPPFIHGVYPPIYPLLLSFAWTSPAPPLSIGRLISILAAVSTAFMIYKILRKKLSVDTSAQLSIIFLTSYFVLPFATTLRVDMPAVFLTLLGIYWFFHLDSAWWASALIFVLAFFTKQTAILAPLALILSLIYAKKWRRLALFSSSYFLTLFAVLYLFNLSTNGQLILHLFSYNNIATNWNGAWMGYALFFVSCLPLLILLASTAARKGSSFFWIYFGMGFLSLASYAKPGGGLNYFIEPLAALILLVGSELGAIAAGKNDTMRLTRQDLLVTSQLLFFILGLYVLWAGQTGSPDAIQATVLRAIRAAPQGEVISEDLGYTLMAGKNVYLEPFQLSRLAREGRWNDAKLIEDCRAQKFSLVWAGTSVMDIPGLADCLNRSYALSLSYKDYYLFTKRSIASIDVAISRHN